MIGFPEVVFTKQIRTDQLLHTAMKTAVPEASRGHGLLTHHLPARDLLINR